MSNATKFILAALVALFVTAAVSYANAEPPRPGDWFIRGAMVGDDPSEYDYYADHYFTSEGACAHAMLADPAVKKDLDEYIAGRMKEYPTGTLTITCVKAVPLEQGA